jgi:hypothetical protein
MQQQTTASPLDMFAPGATTAAAAPRRRRSRRKRGALAPPREELLRHVIGWVKQHDGQSPHVVADVASILEMLGSGPSTESITSCLSRVEEQAPRAGAGRRRVSTRCEPAQVHQSSFYARRDGDEQESRGGGRLKHISMQAKTTRIETVDETPPQSRALPPSARAPRRTPPSGGDVRK